MTRQRKEIRLLAEFLGYGFEQVQENAPTLKTDTEQEKTRIERAYDAGYRDAVSRVQQAITDLYGYDKGENFYNRVITQKKAYFFELLNIEEFDMLCWLSNHGYDGNLMKWTDKEGKEHGITHIGCSDIPGMYKIEGLTENQAWEWRENIIDKNGKIDESFLSCCGSESLSKKLWKVLNSIV